MIEENNNKLIPYQKMQQFATDLLTAFGCSQPAAKATAEGLIHASLRGVDSHGLRLLPHYVSALRYGRVNGSPSIQVNRTSPCTCVLDADHAFGHHAGVIAIQQATELAASSGIGAVTVRNSSHCGCMAYFAHKACEKGMIGGAFTHASPRMKTPGGLTPFLGTNPICFAAPMADEEPFCYDGATVVMPFNKVKEYRASGKKLPPLCATDDRGNMVIEPEMACQLLPIGGYKGFGLAFIVDILCGILTDMPNAANVSCMYGNSLEDHRYLGHFFFALDIGRFTDTETFKARLQATAQQLREEPYDGISEDLPMLPGDPEKQIASKRRSQGIPLRVDLLQQFDELALAKGIPTIEEE